MDVYSIDKWDENKKIQINSPRQIVYYSVEFVPLEFSFQTNCRLTRWKLTTWFVFWKSLST